MGKIQEQIQTLDNLKHRVGENAEYTLFPEPDQPTPDDDTEYWILSDLYNLYGQSFLDMTGDIYDIIWHRFDFDTVKKIKDIKPISRNTIISQHVKFFDNNYTLHTGIGDISKTNARDAKISRYAFYSIINRQPQTAINQLTRAYLIAPHGNPAQIGSINEMISRVHNRRILAGLERMSAGIARRSNIDPRKMNSTAHDIFFGGTPIITIKTSYGITPRDNDPIANYMCAASLHMRANGLDYAIEKYDNAHGRANFEQLLYDGMRRARSQMINKYRIPPEHNISRMPVATVGTRLKELETEFIKRNIGAHVK